MLRHDDCNNVSFDAFQHKKEVNLRNEKQIDKTNNYIVMNDY